MPADTELGQAFADYLSRRLPSDLVDDRPGWAEQRRGALGELAKLSFTQAVLPEPLGGLGLGAAELVDVFREAGARLLPLPLLDAVVRAPVLAGRIGDPKGTVTAHVLDGRVLPVVAPADAPWQQATVTDAHVTVRGLLVEAADLADAVILSCTADGSPAFAVVGVNQAGVHPVPSIDPCRPLFRVDCVQQPADVVLTGGAAVDCHRELTLLSRLAVAAEVTGILHATLKGATEYAMLRVQFGRVIGSYQSIKHLLAGCWREWYALESTCVLAAAAIDSGDVGADRLVLAARVWADRVGRAGAEQTLQAYGAVGFTAEHPQHLFLKRALTLEGQFGSAPDLLLNAGRSVVRAHQPAAR